MKGKNKIQNKRQDFFFDKAKEEGYPARSVYKLKEIDKKYRIIRNKDIVLDLGCAPGSWMMYLSEKVGHRGRVIGVDIQDINIPIEKNMEFIKGDIREILFGSELREIINSDNREVMFDVIVSDMAPKTTGVKFADAEESLELGEEALNVAKAFLKNKGNLVIKIFESGDTAQFIKRLKSCFKIVKRFSPEATRKQSREFYVICKEYVKHINN
jgi:23S rRNA (uridine2552-2'-O)-methyltransferase